MFHKAQMLDSWSLLVVVWFLRFWRHCAAEVHGLRQAQQESAQATSAGEQISCSKRHRVYPQLDDLVATAAPAKGSRHSRVALTASTSMAIHTVRADRLGFRAAPNHRHGHNAPVTRTALRIVLVR